MSSVSSPPSAARLRHQVVKDQSKFVNASEGKEYSHLFDQHQGVSRVRIYAHLGVFPEKMMAKGKVAGGQDRRTILVDLVPGSVQNRE
jgi:hypothetical protein